MWVSAAELLLGSVSHSSGQFIKNFHWLLATSRNPRPQLRGNCICAEGDGSGSFTGLVKKIKLIPREISAAHSAYCQIGNKLFDLRWPPAAQEKKKQWHCIGHLDNKLRCRRVELKLKPPKCSANQNVGFGYYIFQWLLLLLSVTTRVLGRHHNFFPCPVPWWSSLGWGVKPRVQPQLPLQQKSIKCKWMSIGRLNKICRFYVSQFHTYSRGIFAHQPAEALPPGVIAVDRDYKHTGAQDDSVRRPTVNCYLQDQAQIVHTEVITYLSKSIC